MSTIVYPDPAPHITLAQRNAHRHGVVIIVLAFVAVFAIIAGFVAVTVHESVQRVASSVCYTSDHHRYAVVDVPVMVYPTTSYPDMAYAFEHTGDNRWIPVDADLNPVRGADTLVSADAPDQAYVPSCSQVRS